MMLALQSCKLMHLAELQQLARVAAAVKSMQRAAANQCNSRSVKYGYQSCCYVRFTGLQPWQREPFTAQLLASGCKTLASWKNAREQPYWNSKSSSSSSIGASESSSAAGSSSSSSSSSSIATQPSSAPATTTTAA